MRLRPLLTLLILALALVAHRSSRAAGGVPRVVRVILAGNDADVARLNPLLGETLKAVHVRVRIERVERIAPERVSRPTSGDASGIARLWLDCTEPDHARLYLTTADASRIFVREFTFEHGLDAAALELLAFVSRNSITALLAGDELGVAREEYERSLAERAAEADKTAAPAKPVAAPARAAFAPDERVSADRRRNEWHLAASYELEALGSSAIEQGPGAALEWESSALSLGLAGQARFPIEVGDGPIRARLLSRSARLFIARPLRLSAWASFSLSAALGLDWIRVDPVGSGDSASVNSRFSVVEALARGCAGFRYRVSALEFGALAGLEFGFVPARYRVALPSGAAEDVFSPWRLRPLLAVTLGSHW